MHQRHPSEHALMIPAIRATEDAMANAPGVQWLLECAAVSAASGDVATALDIFRTLALVAPTLLEAWNGLARCHEMLGQVRVATTLRAVGHALARGQFEDLPS
jgi:Flp pilus assembly protein TadD